MNFQDYFKEMMIEGADDSNLANFISIIKDSSDLDGVKLAILFTPEYRYTDGKGLRGFDEIVSELSKLYTHGFEPEIGLLGTLIPGKTLEDSEIAVAQVVEELIKHRTVPLVIGGDRDITYSVYKAFENLEEVLNITAIAPWININGDQNDYIGRIVKNQPNYLFNYSNLGFQTYYTSPKELEIAEELYFDFYRLGELRGSIVKSEPVIRSAELFSVSLDAIKRSDFFSSKHPQPNGFYAEEVCQTFRYAGLGEKLKAVVISDFAEKMESSDSVLVAQMIWCLLDGLYSRRSEIPNANNLDFLKYRVSIKDNEFNLIFYKSLRTDRWWMEVPVPPEYGNRYRKHHLIPCDYEDYLATTNDDLPDRWWRAYKKLI